MCLHPDGEATNTLDTRRSVDGIFENESSGCESELITQLLRPPLLLPRQPLRM
jgi:hypothetical protein